MVASISTQVEIRLLGVPFARVDGRSVAVPEGSRSLLSYLALRSAGRARRPLARTEVATALWPDAAEHGAGSLRTAIWRLRSARVPAVESDRAGLRLADGVHVDVDAVLRRAARITAAGSANLGGGTVGREPHAGPGPDPDLDFVAAAAGALDLLPGCYDEWIEDERRRARSAVLDAFDVIAARRRAAGRTAEAIDLVLLAISIDPLRERSQAGLIAAHLAEHNLSEARRAYAAYRRTLASELGVEPSPAVTALVESAAATALPAPGALPATARFTRPFPGTAPARAPGRPSSRTPATATPRARPATGS